jgi:cell division septation protein DedD
MPPARRTTPRRPSGQDVTKALDALNEAISRAQDAAKSVRSDIGRSSIGADLVRNVEGTLRDLGKEARKLNTQIRRDIEKAIAAEKKPAASKPAAKKPAARKPAARKPAAKKPAAKKPAAKPAARKPAARSAAKKPAAKKPAARRTTTRRSTSK